MLVVSKKYQISKTLYFSLESCFKEFCVFLFFKCFLYLSNTNFCPIEVFKIFLQKFR